MKLFAGAFVAALISIGATAASAATITLEATITGITGSAALLSELGITDGTARARVTFDAEVSSGATLVDNQFIKYSRLSSTYSSFSLIAPATTVIAAASDGLAHQVYTQDGIEERGFGNAERFTVRSFLNSSDPGSYSSLSIQSADEDLTKWSRTDPITADLLNSFSNGVFVFAKSIGIKSKLIVSTDITWTEVAAVPLPASLPLLLGSLGAIGLMRRRRRG